MRLPCLGLASLLLASSVAAQAPAGNPSNTAVKKDECSISGVVVKLAGSEPLKKATVQLTNTNDRASTVATTTDSGGRFQLKGLDPGRYRLIVERNGFVDQEYGQTKPDSPGSTLTLRPGQEMKDLLFRMVPSAVIAGWVVDEDGEPLPSAQVGAFREVYSNGKRELSAEANEATNDLGEYRLFGLSPGRYLVRAMYGRNNPFMRSKIQLPADESTEQGYPPTFYPGTPDQAKAVAMTVKSGEEIPSIEIVLRPVNVFTVRGRVINTIAKSSGRVIVQLEPRNTGVVRAIHGSAAAGDKQDGAFEIHDVLPGFYTAIARWFDEGKNYQARQNFEVGNADVEGLTLTIAPGIAVSGQIRWDGPASPLRDELNIYLTVAEGVYGSTSAHVNGDTFAVKDVPEGEYHAEVLGISQDCFVKSVRFGGTEALEEGFTVRRGVDAALEITVSSRGARIQGTVNDADGLPAAGVYVVAVPDDANRSRSRLYKEGNTNQNGRYDLRGLAPGNYKLFSWDQVEAGAWEDPDFLKAFEEKGERISVQEGDTKSMELVAVRSASVEQQKP